MARRQETIMADPDTKAPETPPLPTLEEMQQWT